MSVPVFFRSSWIWYQQIDQKQVCVCLILNLNQIFIDTLNLTLNIPFRIIIIRVLEKHNVIFIEEVHWPHPIIDLYLNFASDENTNIPIETATTTMEQMLWLTTKEYEMLYKNPGLILILVKWLICIHPMESWRSSDKWTGLIRNRFQLISRNKNGDKASILLHIDPNIDAREPYSLIL